MQKKYKKLSQAIKEQNKEEALTIYLKSIRGRVTNNDLVVNVLKDVLQSLYRNNYVKVPHGIMGLLAANYLEKYLSDYPGLAISQAIWYLADENKLAPLDFSVFNSKPDENIVSYNTFKDFVLDGNSAGAYRAFLILSEQMPNISELYSEAFAIAYKDVVNIGHKAIYNMMMFDNIPQLENVPDHIFFPSISYLASEPKDYSIYDIAIDEYNKISNKENVYSQNSSLISDDDADLLINLIINGVRPKLFVFINKLLNLGVCIQSILDTIVLSSTQIILNTDFYEWSKPIHSFNYAYSINWWNRKFKHEKRLLSIFMMAAYLNRISIDHKKVSFDAPAVYAPHKNVLENVIQSIITSNISDTVCLTKSYLFSGGDAGVLVQRICQLACVNDQLNNFMHDIKLCYTGIKEYESNTSKLKYLILVALAKHLSQSTKSYDAFKIYKSLTKE